MRGTAGGGGRVRWGLTGVAITPFILSLAATGSPAREAAAPRPHQVRPEAPSSASLLHGHPWPPLLLLFYTVGLHLTLKHTLAHHLLLGIWG